VQKCLTNEPLILKNMTKCNRVKQCKIILPAGIRPPGAVSSDTKLRSRSYEYSVILKERRKVKNPGGIKREILRRAQNNKQ
jgi:hypothetical protein